MPAIGVIGHFLNYFYLFTEFECEEHWIDSIPGVVVGWYRNDTKRHRNASG